MSVTETNANYARIRAKFFARMEDARAAPPPPIDKTVRPEPLVRVAPAAEALKLPARAPSSSEYGPLLKEPVFLTLGQQPGTLFIRDVIRAVEGRTGISASNIRSQGRTGPVMYARTLVYSLSRTMVRVVDGKGRQAPVPLPTIGRKLGGRDHTTVLSSVNRTAARRKWDDKLDFDLRTLEAELSYVARRCSGMSVTEEPDAASDAQE